MTNAFEVDHTDIIAMCIDFDLQEPDSVIVSDRYVELEYSGNAVSDALTLFQRGLDQYWQYDWVDGSAELKIAVNSDRYGGVTTSVEILRS